MEERFAKPAIGAIIEKIVDRKKHIIIQERWKKDGNETNGQYELPAGKIREYENAYSIICHHFICEAEGEPISETNESRNIRWIEITELAELLKNNRSKFFIMNINAIEKYLKLNNL